MGPEAGAPCGQDATQVRPLTKVPAGQDATQVVPSVKGLAGSEHETTQVPSLSKVATKFQVMKV